MSKHWKPSRQSADLRPSRIRREPVRLHREADLKKAEIYSREREIWAGLAGITLFAVALAALILGLSSATIFHDDPAATARDLQFGQCYDGGPNCVVDGETVYVAGEKVQIAGVSAPAIQGASCSQERDRGIDAAVRLADLLNSGKVSLSGPFRDEYGRNVRKVAVGDEDVAERMIDAGIVRRYDGTKQSWCG